MCDPTFSPPFQSGYRQRRRLRCLGVCLTARGGELLVADCADTGGKPEQPDEAGGVALLVDIIFAECDEPFVVQRELALSADHRSRALEQPERDGSRYPLLGDVDESVVRVALGRPPASLVDQVGVPWCDEVLRGEGSTIEHELLELAMGGVEQGATRRLVDTARLHADESIFDQVDAPNSVSA